MSYSQFFSSFLCIGFLLSIVNGFFANFLPISKIASSSRTSVSINVHHDPCNNPRFETDRRFRVLCAIKGKANISTTTIESNSDKVKQMASFLSIQLLQKVMNESMKPDGESTMNLDAVERLTKALQMSSQPSAEASIVETTGNEDGPDETDLNQVEISVTKPDATFEPSFPPPTENMETKHDDTTTFSRAVENDTIDTLTETQVNEMPEEKERKDGVAVAVPIAERTQSPQQIPKILRKPLEIVQSDIPPLRPESVPRKKSETSETDDQNEEIHHLETCIAEDVDTRVVSEKKDLSDEVVRDDTKSSGASLEEKASLERAKVEELFRRRLLEKKFELDEKQASQRRKDISGQETEKDNDDPTSTVDISEEVQSLGMKKREVEIENPPKNGEESHEGKSKLSIDTKSSKVDQSDLITLKSSIKSSERRIETIVALRQPKSFDEESKLAEKYAQIKNLEDRAYALLCDLGMIEVHIDPRDSTYDHSNDNQYCEQRFLPSL